MTATYASVLELARFINCVETIPDRKLIGEDRVKEEVGTGNNSATRFFLDHAFIIAETYTLSYGAAESSVTDLTETTHYTLDKDSGEITLTTAGKTAVGTNNIYADYSFISINDNQQLTNTQLQDALDDAEGEINERTNNLWVDGTTATPAYGQVLDEKHPGKGRFDRDYFAKKYPIAEVETTLNGALAVSDTTITVVSTNGFPSTGYINIDNDKITYTGKTDTTFTGCTGVDSTHDDASEVYSWVIELSTTSSGTAPTWTVLSKDDGYDLNLESGKAHVCVTDYDLTYYALQYPPRLIPNRFRMSYLRGNNTIPRDIKKLCLLIASREFSHRAVRKGMISGTGKYSKASYDADLEWINNKIETHTLVPSGNV